MNRDSLSYKTFQAYTPPFLDTDELKWLYGPEKIPWLSRNGPLAGDIALFLVKKLLSKFLSHPGVSSV